MLGKLLKYDLRSVGRFWWIAMLTMFGMSFLAGGALRVYAEIPWMRNSDQLYILQMMAYVLFLLSIVAMGFCMLAVLVLIFVRYFKHLFTDEGYLTFTLPASRKQIFFSKVLNAGIWLGLSEVVCAISILVVIFIGIPTRGEGLFATDIILDTLMGIVDSFQLIGGWYTAWMILSILISVAYTMLVVGVAYFCITFGATVVKKAKIVAGVGTYYLINIVSNAFFSIFGTIAGIIFLAGLIVILINASGAVIYGVITLILLITFAIIASLTAFFFCLTLNILERKLNLA